MDIIFLVMGGIVFFILVGTYTCVTCRCVGLCD